MRANILGQRTLGLVAVAAMLLSCGAPKSSSTSGPEGGPVPTGRMTIDLRVESKDASTAVVRANLNDGKTFGKSYRLDGGDFFRACVSGVCRDMSDNDSITSPDYIARFDFQPGADYVVSFSRRKAASAPDSRVVLPPAFVIVTPADHQQVTDGETVIVSWTPNNTAARESLSYVADCTFQSGLHGVSSGGLFSDSTADGRGSVEIDPIVTFARSNTTSPITRCSIELKVSHELQGRIDRAYRTGTALGIVSRVVTVEYVPR